MYLVTTSKVLNILPTNYCRFLLNYIVDMLPHFESPEGLYLAQRSN